MGTRADLPIPEPQLAEYGAKGLTLVRVDTLGAVPKLGLVGVRLDVIALSR